MFLKKLILDHLLGSYVHLTIKKDLTFKKNLEGLLKKGFSVIAGYMLFEMIHQIVQEVDFIAIYFKVLIQVMVILYPAGSAMVNLSIITNGTFPPIDWMKKLKNFNENVDLHEFKTTNHEKDTLINKLTDFSIADEDFEPNCLRGKYWEFIKEDFEEAIQSIKK